MFQVVLPVVNGQKPFPMFRTDPVKEQVAATRELVDRMAEQNANLSELQSLLAERARLEKQIKALGGEEFLKANEKEQSDAK